MPTSRNTSTGNGVTTAFPVTFPYINKSHVKVYLNGVQTSDFVWTSSAQINFTTPPAVGVTVERRRETPDELLVNYNVDALGPSDVDIGVRQALYVAQELEDGVEALTLAAFAANEAATTASAAASAAAASASATAATVNAVAASAAASATAAANAAAADAAATASATATTAAAASAAATAAEEAATDAAAALAAAAAAAANAAGGSNVTYATRAAAAAAAIPEAVTYLRTAGYASSGDGGAALYKRVTDSGPLLAWQFRSNGDTVRWELAERLIRPEMFGAVPDGDDANAAINTAAIQAAIDFAPLGGVVDLSPGRYKVQQSASGGLWCLRITKQIHLRGAGMVYCAITPKADVSSAVPTIVYAPNPALAQNGSIIENLFLGDPFNGTRAGGIGIFLSTDEIGALLPKIIIRGCYIAQAATGGTFSIFHRNAEANVEGGLYACCIENNFLVGGIYLLYSGDSNVIRNNVITDRAGNSTIGVMADLIPGASLLEISHNNITTRGGAIKIIRGPRFRITNNNIEQLVAGANNNAMIDISSENGTTSGGLITGNHLGAFSGTGITACVRIRNSIGHRVQGNTFLPASAATYGIDDAGLDTVAGPNVYGSGSALRVLASGSGTMNHKFEVTPTAPWVNFGSGYENLSYHKSEGGIVTLGGSVTGGPDGSVITTLPVGMRPATSMLFLVATGGGPGTIIINQNGEVVATDLFAGFNSLAGISFVAAGTSNSVSDL